MRLAMSDDGQADVMHKDAAHPFQLWLDVSAVLSKMSDHQLAATLLPGLNKKLAGRIIISLELLGCEFVSSSLMTR